jgi:hypothetical protein
MKSDDQPKPVICAKAHGQPNDKCKVIHVKQQKHPQPEQSETVENVRVQSEDSEECAAQNHNRQQTRKKKPPKSQVGEVHAAISKF